MFFTLSFFVSVVLIAGGLILAALGSTIEGGIISCTGALGGILIMMTSEIIDAIHENNDKKES